MESICGHSPLLSPVKSFRQKQQKESVGSLFRLSSSVTRKLLLPHRKKQCFSSMEAKAVADSIVLVASSPAQSGDISVFLQISGLLFFVYWITNFVVPELLMKSYSADEASGSQTRAVQTPVEDEEDEEDEEDDD